MDRGPFSGARASYVALSCTAILALSLLSGAWVPDNGGAVAVLGLMSVYVSSTECLTLFYTLAPFSAFIDLLRLGGPKDLHGRGWLIFFQLLGVAAKVAGALFAWSMQKSALEGDGGVGGYGGAGPMAGPSMQQPPSAAPRGYARVDDPFSPAAMGSYAIHSQQPPLPASTSAASHHQSQHESAPPPAMQQPQPPRQQQPQQAASTGSMPTGAAAATPPAPAPGPELL